MSGLNVKVDVPASSRCPDAAVMPPPRASLSIDHNTNLAGVDPPQFRQYCEDTLRQVGSRFQDLLDPNIPRTFVTILEPLSAILISLKQVSNLADVFGRIISTSKFDRIREEVQRSCTELEHAIFSEPRLQAAVEAVEGSTPSNPLSDAQKSFLESVKCHLRASGAGLNSESRQKIVQTDLHILRLKDRFFANVANAQKSTFLHVTEPAHLSGLPDSIIKAAAARARENGASGYLLTLDDATFISVLDCTTNAGLHREIFTAHDSLCVGGEFDNTSIALEIAKARRSRAELLGFNSHLEFVLSRCMTTSSTEIQSKLEAVEAKYADRIQSEVALIRAYWTKTLGRAPQELGPWEMRPLREQIRAERAPLPKDAHTALFKYKNVRAALFEVARRLFGVTFNPRPDLSYAEGVDAYEALGPDQKSLGIRYFDLFARPDKTSTGNGCDLLFTKVPGLSSENDTVIMRASLPAGLRGDDAHLTLDVVQRVLCHEFGHAMQQLLGQPEYCYQDSFSAPKDMLELISMLFERLPESADFIQILVEKAGIKGVDAASVADQIRAYNNLFIAHDRLGQAMYAMVDQWAHNGGFENSSDPVADSAAIIGKYWLPGMPTNASRFFQFSHLFGYPADYAGGYFSYVLVMEPIDALERAIHQHGRIDRQLGDALTQHILRHGAMRKVVNGIEEFCRQFTSERNLVTLYQFRLIIVVR